MAIEVTVAFLIDLVGGNCQGNPGKYVFNGVCSTVDSIRGGELFVSLDNNCESQQKAFARGAACILAKDTSLISVETEAIDRLVIVEDVSLALQKLAHWWFRKQTGLKTALVSGEIAKTFVKELLARMLVPYGRGTYTAGSLNSETDLSLSLCEIGSDDQWLVLEADPGALASLTDLSFDVLVWTGTDSALYSEHCKLAPQSRHRVVSELIQTVDEREVSVTSFGVSDKADVFVDSLTLVGIRATQFLLHAGGESQEVFCTVPGEHVALNTACATAAYRCLYADGTLESISAAVRNFNAVPGCLYVHRLPGERYLFDDTAHAGLASLPPLLGLAKAAVANENKIAFIVGEPDAETMTEQLAFIEAIARTEPLCIVSVGENAETFQNHARQNGVPALIAATASAAAHTARKIPWTVLFIKSGKKVQLKQAVSLLLELEGEVLEIPEELTQFGSASLPEEE